jgi:hypothetical protein
MSETAIRKPQSVKVSQMDRIQPQPKDSLDFLREMKAAGRKWHGILDSLLENHRCAAHVYPKPIDPLPEWAVKRIQEAGSADELAFEQNARMLAEAIRLSTGEGVAYRYEVWTERAEPRYMDRLHEGADNFADACAICDLFRCEFPKAFVTKVHVSDRRRRVNGMEWIDTLIPPLSNTSTTFGQGSEHDVFEVQDCTGRSVAVDALELRSHPIFEKLPDHFRERVDFSIKHTAEAVARLNGAAA